MPRRIVYVSSTFKDLEEHRKTLKTALERAGYDVESMERYPAVDERPLDKCLKDVAACDAYVLLLAHRYGYRPEVEGQRTLSITEREYCCAVDKHKPRFVFCVDGNHSWPPKLIDSPGSKDGRSLAALRKRVAEERSLRTFTNPDNLAHQVLEAFSAHSWTEEAQPPQVSPVAAVYHWPAAWDFGPYMAQKRECFVGRTWLFGEVAEWLAAGQPGALLIRADFGVGKSAFMAELVRRNPGGCIAAWHFCQHDTHDTLHPGHFVQSIATQLALALPQYKALVESEPAMQDRLNRALEDPSSALEGGVLAPLARLPVPSVHRLLLVDALDESLEADPNPQSRYRDIVSLLATRAARFPAWLRVLATTRSNPRVLTPLQAGFTVKLIDAESNANQADLRQYVLQRTAREPLANRLREAGTTTQALADLIVEKCQGKFLLAERALRALEVPDSEKGPSRLRVEELAALPPGMDSWYMDAFERRFARAGRDYEPARAMLGVLVVVREPLPFETIAAVLHIGLDAVKAVYRQLPDFLRLRAGRLTFDHFSTAEWLTREDDAGFARAGDYAVNLLVAQDLMRTWALAQVETSRVHENSYLLRHLAGHLADDAERHRIYSRLMLTQFEWIQARLDQDGVYALLADVAYIKKSPEQSLLEAVLRNGTHVLRSNPEQLAAQVLGRVGKGLGGKLYLSMLVDSACQYLDNPKNLMRLTTTLLPIRRSLRLSTSLTATLQGISHVLTVLPDGRIVSGDADYNVRVTDPQGIIEPLVFEGHQFHVTALAVLLDGRIASGGGDGAVHIWDPSCRAKTLVFKGHTDAVCKLIALPDGRIASSSRDCTARVWDPQQNVEPLVLNGHSDWVESLAVLPDGRIVSGSRDGTVRVWSSRQKVEPVILNGHTDSVLELAVSLDGHIVSGGEDGTVRVWDPQYLDEPMVLKGHEARVCALAVLPDGRIASGDGNGIVYVWNLQCGAKPLVFKEHTDSVHALAALPDGRIASGSRDCTVRVWNPGQTSKALVFEAHTAWVIALAVLPDGRIVSSSYNYIAHVWNPQIGVDTEVFFEGHRGSVTVITALLDGRIASGGEDGTVRVWHSQINVEALVFERHERGVRALTVLPDGQIASGGYYNTVCIWEPRHHAKPLVLEGHEGVVMALTTLSDGRIASGGHDGTLRIWDLHRSLSSQMFDGYDGTEGCVLAALPDGRIASGGERYSLRIWGPLQCAEAETRIFEGHRSSVKTVAVLPDGRIASGSADGTVRIWSLRQKAGPLVLEGYEGEGCNLVVLPDGRIAFGGMHCTLQIWDPQCRAEPLVLKGHEARVCALVVLPDGRIASGSEDHTVRVWDLQAKKDVQLFVSDAPIRCLTVTKEGLIAAGGDDGAVHLLSRIPNAGNLSAMLCPRKR